MPHYIKSSFKLHNHIFKKKFFLYILKQAQGYFKGKQIVWLTAGMIAVWISGSRCRTVVGGKEKGGGGGGGSGLSKQGPLLLLEQQVLSVSGNTGAICIRSKCEAFPPHGGNPLLEFLFLKLKEEIHILNLQPNPPTPPLPTPPPPPYPTPTPLRLWCSRTLGVEHVPRCSATELN